MVEEQRRHFDGGPRFLWIETDSRWLSLRMLLLGLATALPELRVTLPLVTELPGLLVTEPLVTELPDLLVTAPLVTELSCRLVSELYELLVTALPDLSLWYGSLG